MFRRCSDLRADPQIAARLLAAGRRLHLVLAVARLRRQHNATAIFRPTRSHHPCIRNLCGLARRDRAFPRTVVDARRGDGRARYDYSRLEHLLFSTASHLEFVELPFSVRHPDRGQPGGEADRRYFRRRQIRPAVIAAGDRGPLRPASHAGRTGHDPFDCSSRAQSESAASADIALLSGIPIPAAETAAIRARASYLPDVPGDARIFSGNVWLLKKPFGDGFRLFDLDRTLTVSTRERYLALLTSVRSGTASMLLFDDPATLPKDGLPARLFAQLQKDVSDLYHFEEVRSGWSIWRRAR